MTDYQQTQRAVERSEFLQSVLSGTKEEGATKEIEQTLQETEDQLKEKATRTGSKPVGHAADVVKAERLLFTKKDLGDRFLRISNRLSELQTTKPSVDVKRIQEEMENLRPLLRLTLRSDEFRNAMLAAIRIAKHVLEENVEGSVERIIDRGEREGVSGATEEAQNAVKGTIENIDEKEKVISDADWNRLADELDILFQRFNQHTEFRNGVKQLFSLGSSLSYQFSTTSSQMGGTNYTRDTARVATPFSRGTPTSMGTTSMGITSMGTTSMGTRSMGTTSMGTTSMGTTSMGTTSMGTRSMGTRSMGTTSMSTTSMSTTSMGTRSMGTTSMSTATSTPTSELRQEAKELVAQFSGEEELDSLFDSLNSLWREIENNQAATQWWNKFRDLTLRVTTSYRGRQDIDEYRNLFNEGRNVFRRHKDRINESIDKIKIVIDNIANDKLVGRLRESLATLSDDLYWEDQEGNRYFDAEAASNLGSSISDIIRNQFKYLALPEISRREDTYAYTLNNVVINANLPTKIDFHLESDASIDTDALAEGTSQKQALKTRIYLQSTIKGITAQAKDIHFTYQSFSTPAFAEDGIMSVNMGGKGADLSIEFVMRPTPKTSGNVATGVGGTSGLGGTGAVGVVGGGMMRYEFVRTKSHFNISDLDINFKKETLSHNFLVPFITNLFKARVIAEFESGIEQALDESLINLGKQVTDILNRSPNPLSISSLGEMVMPVE